MATESNVRLNRTLVSRTRRSADGRFRPRCPNTDTAAFEVLTESGPFAVAKPLTLCNAADQDGGGVESVDHRLVCHQVKPAASTTSQPKHVSMPGIFVGKSIMREVITS
jgi:hypothetical protein